jgi:hypothetical protein
VVSSAQTTRRLAIPQYLEHQFNLAYAQSAFVVFVFSVPSSGGFDGYALLAPGPTSVPRREDGRLIVEMNVEVVRRSLVMFDEVKHIRDPVGLHGGSIVTAKDGNLLGIAAGRALCRLIDKSAYRDDPFHYKDDRRVGRIVSAKSNSTPSTIVPPVSETDILTMDYVAYKEWYDSQEASILVPTLGNILSR